jgi:hypothetical protein
MPMARNRAALVMACVAVGATGCSGDGDVSRAIGAMVREPQVRPVVLSDATGFTWDEVYLFDPYAPRSSVCLTLKIAAPDCIRTIPFDSADDGEMSIAFLHRGRVVNYVRHSRRNGDFAPVPTEQPLSPATAVFRVVREVRESGGPTRFRLVLAAPHGQGMPRRQDASPPEPLAISRRRHPESAPE